MSQKITLTERQIRKEDTAVIGIDLKVKVTATPLEGDKFQEPGERITVEGANFEIHITKRGDDISLMVYGDEEHAWDDQRFMLEPRDDDEENEE